MTALVRDSGVRTQIVDSERTLFTTGMHGFADAWQSLRRNWGVAADCDVRALAVVTISQLVYGLARRWPSLSDCVDKAPPCCVRGSWLGGPGLYPCQNGPTARAACCLRCARSV